MDKFEKATVLGAITAIIITLLMYGFIAWVIIKLLAFYGII